MTHPDTVNRDRFLANLNRTNTPASGDIDIFDRFSENISPAIGKPALPIKDAEEIILDEDVFKILDDLNLCDATLEESLETSTDYDLSDTELRDLDAIIARKELYENQVSSNNLSTTDPADIKAGANRSFKPIKETYKSRYDRALTAYHDAKLRLAAVPEGNSKERLSAVVNLRLKENKLETEAKRSDQPKHQKLEAIDEYRAGAGRLDHNTKNRKVRLEPNTERSILDAMSEDEYADHRRKQKAESAKKCRTAKKAAEREIADKFNIGPL